MSLYKQTIADRFWKYVEMIPFHGCWEWSGNRNPAGYGRIDIRKKSHRAHRLSWELFRGPIASGLVVCHKCDNPGCVNPAHLFLGTDGDNTRDRNAKGRANMPNGVRHFKAKLKPHQIVAIRASDKSSRYLAGLYNVSHHAILCIKQGKTWKNI